MRTLGSRLARWALLTGDRYAVSGLVLGLVAIVLSIPGMGTVLQDTTPLLHLYSVLIGGNITLITIVVSINQLVLAREFESPAALRVEIRETTAYRRAATNQPAVSSDPVAFLSRMIQQLRQQTRAIEDIDGEDATAEIDRLTATLTDYSGRVITQLSSDDSGLFDVVSGVVRASYVDRMREVRRIQSTHRDEFSDEAMDALDDLVVHLEHLDIARHYFLTIFIQRELSKLSRVLVATGVPAVTVAAAMLVYLTGVVQPFPGVFGLVVTGAVIGLLPLSLLASFVVRIALVAQHVSITPFETS